MMKLYPRLLCTMLAAAACGTAWATPFDYIQDFDDPDAFTDGQGVPQGWTATGSYLFKRLAAASAGLSAFSGEYALVANPSSAYGRDETFCTQAFNLRGGATCKIRFQFLAPGGTPSSVRYNVLHVAAGTEQDYTKMTELGKTKQGASDWTEYEFEFTPEADGDYYFGFKLEAPLGQSGYVLVDDIEVVGDTPDGEVTPSKPTAALPYAQSFDNKDDDYDGTSYLPNGWASVGTLPFVTANRTDLPATDGTYYMVTGESAVPRDESAFTPYFDLKAGVTYTMTFDLYMPGNLEGDDPRYTTMSVTAGQDQTREAQDDELLVVMYTNSKQGWESKQCTFTPTSDGLYCFGFNLFSELPYTGPVAVDNLLITAPGLVQRPTAAFTYDGLFNIMDSHLLCFHGDDTVKMINTSLYGETYKWEAPGAEPETSTEENPSFRFPNNGEYTVKLTATNATGERTTSRTIKVSHFEGSQYLGVFDYMPGDKIINGYTDVPTFKTDETYDFISGFNHYYRRFAERFALPEGMQLQIGAVNTWLVSYSIMMAQTAEERNFPCRMVFYGETNGLPDETKVFGSVESTVKDMYGQQGIGLENSKGLGIEVGEKPIYVAGPFYVSFEFSDSMPIDSPYERVPRSYLALSLIKHQSGRTTLYARPNAVPEGSTAVPGQWCRADEVSPETEGYGLNLTLWGTLNDGSVTSISSANVADSQFAVTLNGDDLTVTGAQPGERIVVYDLTGRARVSATASATGLTTLSLDQLGHGTYVVASASGQQKFVK